MAETDIMAGIGTGMGRICTYLYPSSHPLEKVEDSPYPYLYPVNARILCQNRDGFRQIRQGWVYLSSLVINQHI